LVGSEIVIVSNRGPVSFATTDHGGLEERRGGGGLVSGLGGLRDQGALWVAGAATDGDRIVASQGTLDVAGFGVSLVAPDPADQRAAYDVVSNETLWFLHHGIFDATRTPSFDDEWREAWNAYRCVNRLFAERVAEVAPQNATVLVQDYHLTLVATTLAEIRPDLATVHFHHTPFASAEEMSVLPDDVATELMNGLIAHVACGFHTSGWAERFESCAVASGLPARTFVSPLSVDVEEFRHRAAQPDVDAAVADLTERIGGRHFLARVDRIELSKNLLRGFAAFELFLERQPERHGSIVFGAFCYPSRQGVPAYAAYHDEVRAAVDRVNTRFATADWTPVLWEENDQFPTSLAAYRLADILMVNPVRDGLNLVAKEASVVNERSCDLVLSDRAGCVDEIGPWCDVVSPFDVSGTATALTRCVDRHEGERADRFADRAAAVEARSPSDWLAEQVRAAER